MSYEYSTSTEMSPASIIVSLALSIAAIAALWKIFTKAGKPGWAAIIPIYNIIVLFQIVGLNPLMVLLFLVPIANIIISIMVELRLAKAFGKGVGFALGLMFLGPIFYMILGFGSSTYLGPQE